MLFFYHSFFDVLAGQKNIPLPTKNPVIIIPIISFSSIANILKTQSLK